MNSEEESMKHTVPNRVGAVVSSWPFAVFIIALAISVTALLAMVLWLPTSATGLGAFAVDFKIWCFGYDPATGELEWGYVFVMLANPLILSGFVYLVWSDDIRKASRTSRFRLVLTSVAGAFTACCLAVGLLVSGPDTIEQTELPFPAERLRTAISAPDFKLLDQNEEPITLKSLEGRVVLLTAIYTTCHSACPMIVIQARRAMDSLPPELRKQVTVVAVTLDPENDTPERLRIAAKAHQLPYPEWQLLTGEPEDVNVILDRYSFSRMRNTKTGEIDHANMFVLIDKKGRIAYRLNLGDRHANWLSTALKLLTEEGSRRFSHRPDSSAIGIAQSR